MNESTEDQRLKAAGIALLLLAGLGTWWLSHRVDEAWPVAIDYIVPFIAGTLLVVNVFVAGVLILAAGCGVVRLWHSQRRRQAIALKILLANLLVPAVLYGLLTSDDSIDTDLTAQGWDVPVSLALGAFGLIAWRLWRRSRRYEAPDAAQVIARDPRPPVLYLRSFKDDGDVMLDDGGWAWMRRIMAMLAPKTTEEELVEILDHVGPVVAIGKPGEPLPELGAARLYVEHDRWQKKVTELMQSASLVVVRVGSSSGVRWEIEKALAVIPRPRLVLALLGGATIAPEVFAILASFLGTQVQALFPDPPPSGWAARAWRDPRRRLGGVVCFAQDGTPRTVPVSAWPPRGRDMLKALAFRPSALPLRRAWRQVFAHLGIDAGSMGRRRSRGIAVVLALLFGYVGAHWFYLGNRRHGWNYVMLFPLALASVFMSCFDALRFVWVDRATFDTCFVKTNE